MAHSLLALWFIATPGLHAFDSSIPLSQFTEEQWQTGRGLPQNSVYALVQDQAGYIWLGTQNGLARFDGVRFHHFHTGNTIGLPHNYVYRLLVARDGTLWGGTRGGGIFSFDGRVFDSIGTNGGLSNDHVWSLAEGLDGAIWVGTRQGLNRCLNGKITSYGTGDGLPDSHVTALHAMPNGTVWVGGANSGLARFRNGSFETVENPHLKRKPSVQALASFEGKLYVGYDGEGVFTFQEENFSEVLPATRGQIVETLLFDESGGLWVGTQEHGVIRCANQHASTYCAEDGLSHDHVAALLIDRESSVWIGTVSGGLNRIQEPLVQTFTSEHGLRGEDVACLYEDQDGVLWIGTMFRGLFRYEQGRFSEIPAVNERMKSIRALLVTRDNALWIGSEKDGLGVLSDETLNWPLAGRLETRRITSLYEDREGLLWIGSEDEGLISHDRENHTFKRHPLPPGSARYVRCFAEDQDGTLWIGTQEGLFRRSATGFDRVRGADLGRKSIRHLHVDQDNVLWVATRDHGLIRRSAGSTFVYNTGNGLPHNLVNHILETGTDLWLSGNRGIQRVSKDDLEAVAAGGSTSLTVKTLNEQDGLRTSQSNGGYSPSGFQTRDGRLWFPTKRGLAMIDPRRARPNTDVPPVVIESVLSDGLAVPFHKPVEISAGATRLVITYTGLSFRAPSQVRFKHKLEGMDHDWVDAGFRREAAYYNLKPGNYRFSVMASNEEGLWNTEGASLAFSVAPLFYQTWWFYIATGTLLTSLGFGCYRWRVRAVSRKAADLEAMIAARTTELKSEIAQRRAAERQLLTVNDQLEERVAHRTSELRRAYHELEQELREREKIESALTSSEARFRRVVESGMIGIFYWDANGSITEANETFLRMSGYTREELRRGELRWDNLTPPEFLRLDQAALAEIAQTGICEPFEKEYFHKNGARVPILAGGASLVETNDSGVCFLIDISERKKAEREILQLNQTLEERVAHRTSELGRSHQKLEMEIQERKRVAVALETFSRLGQTLQATRTEMEAAQVIAQAARELIPYDRCAIELYNAQGSLDSILELPREMERRAESTLSVPIRNGERVIGSLTLQCTRPHGFNLADTNTLQALGDYCGGALDRIRSQQARLDLERRFSAFMTHAPALAWMKDASFRHVFTNQSFHDFLGTSGEELEGRTDFDLWPEPTAARLRSADLEVTETGKMVETTEALPQAGGASRTFHILRFPFTTASGERFVAGMAIDVTEQKRAEEALHLLPQRILEAQEQERRRVARELHDSVNQPIASIKFRVQTAEQHLSLTDEKWLESCRKMKEMLDSVLNQVRRISHNLRPSELDDFGLVPAVQTTCQEFQNRTRLPIDLCCSGIEERLPAAIEISLYRILQEALTNIEKHSGARHVSIELALEEGGITLEIADDGKGFPMAQEGSAKSGLGLLHIRERATFIGGVLAIKTAPGEGVRMTIHAPVLTRQELAYA